MIRQVYRSWLRVTSASMLCLGAVAWAAATVTWTNLDDEPHTAVSDTGEFRSGAMDTNESFSFKFEKPGTYHFTCSIHPRMVGTIIVQ